MSQSNTKITVSIEPMDGENWRQYFAWDLYTIYKSHKDLIDCIKHIINLGSKPKADPAAREAAILLKSAPGLRTIKEWSRKFHWVERTKLREEFDEYKAKAEKTKKFLPYLISELMEIVLKRLKKQMDEGERATVADLKLLWEMDRVEQGLPSSIVGNKTIYEEIIPNGRE